MNLTETETDTLAQVRALLDTARSAIDTLEGGDLPTVVVVQLLQSAAVSASLAVSELRGLGVDVERSARP